MKLTEVNADPAIIDIEIPELESFDFDSYFNLVASRSDYGTLIVAQGRETITHKHSLHTKLFKVLADPIYQITKKLCEMDKTRYTLFKFSDFEEVGTIVLGEDDVVRNPLIKKIEQIFRENT